MFKKIIIAVISTAFIASAAFADVTSIGVRISAATLSASGTTESDSAGTNQNTGGAKTTQKEKDGDFELPSIFIEHSIEVNGQLSITAGIDFVPLTENVASLGGGNGVDAKVAAGNLMTMYIQPTFALNEMISVFGKVGYASGDLEITSITRQAQTAVQTNDDASTDTSANKTLAGPVVGLGIQLTKEIGFVRLEGTKTDFDTIKHTASNGKRSTADAELELITLSIGKSF